jgi:hypothetical protein
MPCFAVSEAFLADLPADVLEATDAFEEQLACMDDQALFEQRKASRAMVLHEND